MIGFGPIASRPIADAPSSAPAATIPPGQPQISEPLAPGPSIAALNTQAFISPIGAASILIGPKPLERAPLYVRVHRPDPSFALGAQTGLIAPPSSVIPIQPALMARAPILTRDVVRPSMAPLLWRSIQLALSLAPS